MALDLNEFMPLSWDHYFKLVNNLVDQILERGEKYDRIVGITRCGLVLGHVLSDMLWLPVSIFTIKSYTDFNKQDEVRITEDLSADIKGDRILLVDGLADTGKTFVKAVEYLKGKNPKSITTAAVFYKPHSIFKPDFYAEETPKWVLFPYEFSENATLLKNKVKKEGGNLNSVLETLGYSEEGINLLKRRKVI
jgi:hypoxanthine phosphoribosyltransferase